MLVMLVACHGDLDYTIVRKVQPALPGQEPPPHMLEVSSYEIDGHTPQSHRDIREVLLGEPNEVEMKFDAAIQRMGWGADVKRCQLQLSFQKRKYSPPAINGNPPPSPPENPGDCVFHREDLDPQQGGPHHDNWYISGELYGPEEVYLYGIEQDFVLPLTLAEDGLLRYELQDCSLETFPFEEIFDLEIPNSINSDLLPPIYIEAAIGIGPDIQFIAPSQIYNPGMYYGHGGDDLGVSWEYKGEVPMIDDQELYRDVRVSLTNNKKGHWNARENMSCLPITSTDTTLPGEAISEFSLNDHFGQDLYSIGLNIHTMYEVPDFIDPWGSLVHSRTTISIGGMMELIEGTSD